MATEKNRQIRLAKRPVGLASANDFRTEESPLPTLREGEALVRTLYLSLDPTNRIWMSDMDQYMPPVEIGDVMRAGGVGQIVQSKNPALPEGRLVSGLLGWQDYSVVGGDRSLPPSLLPASKVPITAHMGALGMTGLTAYFGLLDIGKPKAGETVVVSAAAGATGSVAGQIAKIKGCRVVGIAGGAEKCAWIKDDLGFDAAVDYKAPDWKEQLSAACPNGIDVNFENVGGAILDAVLARMNLNGRVALCGLISTYNAKEPVPGPYNFAAILMKRLRIEGFIVIDFGKRYGEALRELSGWYLEGKLKHRDTIVEGLEHAPSHVNKLFEGSNIGKLLIKVADAPLPVPTG